MKIRLYNLIGWMVCSMLTVAVLGQEYDVKWRNREGTTFNETTHTLTKTRKNGWSNAGAISQNRLNKNKNGYFKYPIENVQTIRFIGLSTFNKSSSWRRVDYGFYQRRNRLYIIERGRIRGYYGHVKVGDVLKVARIGDKIVYKKNNQVLRKRNTSKQFYLHVDVSIYNQNATISAVKTSFPINIGIRFTPTNAHCDSNLLGSVTTQITGGVPPYTVSWDHGPQTENLQNLNPGRYVITVTDATGQTKRRALRIYANLSWQDEVNVAVSGGDITKTNNSWHWNAGARSANVLQSNQNGIVEYTIPSYNEFKAFGLSEDDPNQSIRQIDHAVLLLSRRRLVVMENGSFVGIRRYKVGDKVKIFRHGNWIQYRLNNTLIHKTRIDRSKELFVDASIRTPGGSLNGIRVDFCPPKTDLVLETEKISFLTPGMQGTISNGGAFGLSMACIGDLDKDGVDDLVVSEYLGDVGGTNAGLVWVLFMNSDGTVKHTYRLDGIGDLYGYVSAGDLMGFELSTTNDINKDGKKELLISGVRRTINGQIKSGIVLISQLRSDGSVEWINEISGNNEKLSPYLTANSNFGSGITSAGDIDGDGIEDLAIGALGDSEGAPNQGAVYLLFMNQDLSIKNVHRINSASETFTHPLQAREYFGHALTKIDDLDGDGIPELAVGSAYNYHNGSSYVPDGRVRILYLNPNGSLKADKMLDKTLVGGVFADGFGMFLENTGDLNNDGISDLLVGAHKDDQTGTDQGAAYVVYLNQDGSILGGEQIVAGTNGFTGTINDADRFGQGLCYLGDFKNNGHVYIAVGAPGDDDGGSDKGAVYVLKLDRPAPQRLMVEATVTDAPINQHGGVQLNITGGVPPYQVYWDIDDHLTPYQFNTIKNEKRSFLADAGIDESILESIQYSDFQNHFSSTTNNNLKPGIHRAFVHDSKGNSTYVKVSVNTPLQVETNNGLQIEGNRISKPAGTNEWGTFIESANYIGEEENGYVEVQVENLTSNFAFGFKVLTQGLELNALNLPLPNADFAYGLEVEGNKVYQLENGSRVELGNVAVGDRLGIEKNGEKVLYTKNGDYLNSSTGANKAFQIKINMKALGSQLILISLGGGTYPVVSTQVSHIQCGAESSGEILVGVYSSSPHTVELLDQSGTVIRTFHNMRGLDAGVYTLRVTNAVGTYQKEIWIGHSTLWTEKHLVHSLPVPNQNSLYPTANAYGSARSNNQLNSGDEGWQRYQLWDQHPYSYFDNAFVKFNNGSNHFGGVLTFDLGANYKLNFLVEYDGAFSFSPMGTTHQLANYSINRAANNVLGYWVQNVSNTTPVAYQPGSLPIAGDLTAHASLNGYPGMLLRRHISSYGCIYADNAFLLQEKLTAGYYHLYGQILRFDYNERYEVENGKQLQYRIFDEQRNLVAGIDHSGTPLVSNSPTNHVQYGFNVCELDLTNLGLASGSYLLEVTTPKNDKTYLRFKL